MAVLTVWSALDDGLSGAAVEALDQAASEEVVKLLLDAELTVEMDSPHGVFPRVSVKCGYQVF